MSLPAIDPDVRERVLKFLDSVIIAVRRTQGELQSDGHPHPRALGILELGIIAVYDARHELGAFDDQSELFSPLPEHHDIPVEPEP